MRHIANKRNMVQLEESNETPPQTAQEATSQWQRFRHRALVSQHLLAEQYGLCAYTELNPEMDGIGVHIEHIKPKSRYPEQTFDHLNLVVNALHSEDLQSLPRSQVFGGHAKLAEYDPDLFISCVNSDCATFFAYLSDGRIVPSASLDEQQKQQAAYTINLLNLNSPYLVTRRKNWLEEIDTLIDAHIDQDWSLPDLAAVHLIPSGGAIYPFFSATRSRFGHLAEQVLALDASELV